MCVTFSEVCNIVEFQLSNISRSLKVIMCIAGASSINAFKSRLCYIRDNRMGFLWTIVSWALGPACCIVCRWGCTIYIIIIRYSVGQRRLRISTLLFFAITVSLPIECRATADDQTLSDLHSPIARLFNCDFLYNCGVAKKILIDTECCAFLLR